VPAKTKSGATAVSLKAINWAVTVVPILAPIMMAMAAASDKIPAFKKPIRMTDVALELWITAVTPSPTSIDLMRLEVIFSSRDFKMPSDSFLSESLSRNIP